MAGVWILAFAVSTLSFVNSKIVIGNGLRGVTLNQTWYDQAWASSTSRASMTLMSLCTELALGTN
jgi:hypothetical protein